MSEQNQDSIDIWGKSQEGPSKPYLKSTKKRWGLVEVVNSVVILICLQIVFSLYLILKSIRDSIGSGVDSNDINALTAAAAKTATDGPNLFISSLLMYAAWLFMMWYSSSKRGHKSWAKDFWIKFNFKKDILIGAGIAAVLTAVQMGLGAILSAAGVDLTGADNAAVILNQKGIWFFIMTFGVACLVGPIMEESFFRGFLFQGLIRHFRRGNVDRPRSVFGATILNNFAPVFNGYISFRNWCYKHKYIISAIISSAFFGLMHFQGVNNFGNWYVVAITGTLGFVFALSALKFRRLGPGIFGHIFFNTFSVVLSIILASH
jgi:membrane protease YdiL (CAAX protease family)